MRFFNKRKSRLVRDEGQTKRIQVQPKRRPQKSQQQQVFPTATKKSPPPDYESAIKTISSLQAGSSNKGIKSSQIESYRTFNGRTYAVVKNDGGVQLVPTRAPSAAIFNYQYAYNNY